MHRHLAFSKQVYILLVTHATWTTVIMLMLSRFSNWSHFRASPTRLRLDSIILSFDKMCISVKIKLHSRVFITRTYVGLHANIQVCIATHGRRIPLQVLRDFRRVFTKYLVTNTCERSQVIVYLSTRPTYKLQVELSGGRDERVKIIDLISILWWCFIDFFIKQHQSFWNLNNYCDPCWTLYSAKCLENRI